MNTITYENEINLYRYKLVHNVTIDQVIDIVFEGIINIQIHYIDLKRTVQQASHIELFERLSNTVKKNFLIPWYAL